MGLNKGEVIDLHKLSNAISKAVEKAEEMAGFRISNITCNITGGLPFTKITSDNIQITNDFIKPLQIPHNRVLMMPGLDHQDNFHERTEWCLGMAKKYGYVGLTRLHISAWNQTTGV